MKILIVKLSAIGDVIHTLPAVNALRRHYPQAHITWLVESAAADLVIGHPAVDRVIVSRRKEWIRALRSGAHRQVWPQFSRFFSALREDRYDLVFDFQALLKSGVMIALTKAGQKIGFDRGMEHMEHSYWFLNRRIPAVSMERHALLRNLELIKAAGVACRQIEYRLPIPDSDRRKVAVLLQRAAGRGSDAPAARPLVAVNPVAKWESKLWSERGFAAVADAVQDRYGGTIVFTGSAADRPAVDRIRGRMRRGSTDLAGSTSLKQLAALFATCDLLISTDTGPMHLAAAVDTPVVALFGPTAPWRTGPFGSGHQVVRAPLRCGPCFKRRCHKGGCMSTITAAQVLKGVDRILQPTAAAPGR
jgi:heptosyltransferase-1